MQTRLKNFLKKSKIREVYEYPKDGIYIIWGPWKGLSLTTLYNDCEEVVERFIDNILDSDEAPFKLKWQTKQVLQDLKNNYPNYEKF